MLKIKNILNLKELEKFGFEHHGDFYCKRIDVTDVIIDESSRVIEIDFEINTYSINEYNDLLYDLIKADMVEKVI
jgi:hypothetical protein